MLPSINKGIKSYVWFFNKKFENTTPPYNIQMLTNQKLKITIPPVSGGPYTKLILYIEFTENDCVKTAIDTDDKSFYTSLFYIEVIRKKRDNEAWQEIKKKYQSKLWVEKYIHFLLKAPTTIIQLLE
jgi:hypothetical protein|tara:strand:+ start:251 stop:631 length:381 start_codon:yes stop_codon:yes gene_type:complete